MCSTALCIQSSGSNEGENMDAPLQDCTIEEQRGVVRLVWAEGEKSVEIHRRMLAQYGQSTMRQRKVYQWMEKFNPLTSNDHYSGGTAPLTSKGFILYIYSTTIGTEYF